MKLSAPIICLAFLVTFFSASRAYCAGEIKVHPLYLEERHRSDYISAVIRDVEGFLWIGTDNGLKRYDGYNLRIFTRDAAGPGSIGTNAIRSLLVQSTGALWVGGSNLNLYHPETESFTSYNPSDEIPIRAVYEDDFGHFWLAGEGFGLRRFDPASGSVDKRFFEGVDRGRIYHIARYGLSAKIWLASDAGLMLFDTQTYEVEDYPLPLDLDSGIEAIRGLTEDREGRVWVATHTGLFVIDPVTKAYQHYQAQPGIPNALVSNALSSIAMDSQGRIWVGTDKLGVHKYVPETDSFLHLPASADDRYRFPPGDINHIYEDPIGNLWFSAGAHGLFRVSSHVEKFRAFQRSFETNNSLSFNNVLAMHEDRNGIIWVGTDGRGLNRFDPSTNQFTHFRHDPLNPNSLSDDAIVSIAEDSKGYLWLGTWGGGVNRLNPITGEFKRVMRDPTVTDGQTLADNNIFRIVVDERDRLLLAVGRAGLQIYDPQDQSFESFSSLNPQDASGIRSDYITAIEPTPEGDYWMAGYRGIERFSPNTKTFFQPDFNMFKAVSDLYLDKDGYLWIATSTNLIRYNPLGNDSEEFGVTDGLSDEYVVSILQDDLGYLWLGTRNGLNRFNPQSKEVIVFDDHDGLAGAQFNRFSRLKTRDGAMYFGGPDGFSYFHPLDMPRNDRAPKVHLTHLYVNQELQLPGQSPWLKAAINHTSSLVLPRSHADVAIQFSATNFIAPAKNQYRYRLLGLEEEWRLVDSSHRQVRYSNLSPGSYQFQVLASNNEQVWGGSARTLQLTILPAWWQTWWAIALYGMVLLAVMHAFSYWRLRSNRKREKQLQLLVDDQTSKLRKANRSIIQLNSELEQRVEHRTKELSLEIEERRESEQKANYIAYHDALTGLHNRAWLLQHLQQLLERPQGAQPFALLFVGGDRFRKINDTYGHLQGDMLLMAAAQRLNSVLPEGACAVRLGSDEFTVVVDEIESELHAVSLAEAIISVFKEQFMIEQVRMSLSVSVGVLLSDPSYVDPLQVLRNANIAMQRAKDRGRGIYQLFDDEILQQTLDTAALEADLKVALAKNQFRVVYQPIIIVETGDLNGFEILIRWQHPTRGMVPPDKFIAMAESLGLIFDIGLWVLEQACRQLQAWQAQFKLVHLPTIAVNLSPVQLDHAHFLDRVDQVLISTGVNREHIKFEITESALMKHTDTVDGLLEALRERGIELAIDDFGTGYSSLSYLDKLPVQVLKIDRSFVNALTDLKSGTEGAHEIVRATISLAHNLNMRVVAEGIETQEQLNALQGYRCDYGQGYFIARPLSPEDAGTFLAKSTVAHLFGPPDHQSPG